MTTSATGGYLVPAVASPPLEDAELDAQLQKLIVGVSGLAGQMVRPRWQPTVPKQPEPTVNWCAFGVVRQRNDAGPAIQHEPDGEGQDRYIRHQDLSLLCSFYGPSGKGYAQALADGLTIPQNNEAIGALDMRFIDADDIFGVPELVNQQWIRRYDLNIRLRRKITRTYAVLNLLSAEVSSNADGSNQITTNNIITE
ncbi:hypothetical protein [Herbaspirillum robiniae]|uniref:phage neck terminator protein n=1 Tax=Herbaspirillum robiniae TaxID=2014887 RepID=UPI0009A24C73|nr:hypothetical protein [Herbaspirillum robiniae]